MFDKREKNAEIFRDTQKRFNTDPELAAAVEASIAGQRFVAANETIDISFGKTDTRVYVSEKRSLEAAAAYAREGKKVCVLNFASASNPGGGVVNGASAQEESICRCSTLYPCLNTKEMWEKFYTPHRIAADPLHNDDLIITPDVVVFKSDISFPEPLPRESWYKVDIITCAAPNLRQRPSNEMNPNGGSKPVRVTSEELYALHESRARKIISAAISTGCQVLILGAFGCGAFKNSPKVVAEVYHNITKEYFGCFETIEFAIYHIPRDNTNFDAFNDIMK